MNAMVLPRELRGACSPVFMRRSSAASSRCVAPIRGRSKNCSKTGSLFPPRWFCCWSSEGCCSRWSVATSFRPSTADRFSFTFVHRPEPGSNRPSATSRRSKTRSARSFPRAIALMIDNIGLPARAYNLAFTDGSTIGVNDGFILVSLKEGHAPTGEYVRKLRTVLPETFPEDTFYFQAADMVSQILNFGLPAQIDVNTGE